jgi:protein SCO1/2
MVSLDADRDTPETLRIFKQKHHIEDPRWIVARTATPDVRLLAAALGVRYRELPDHSFNHSAFITLLDQDGVVRARAEGVRAADEAFLRAIQTASEQRASLGR